MEITRRDFLKTAGAGFASLLIPEPLKAAPSSHEGIDGAIADKINVALGGDYKWTKTGEITNTQTLLESMKQWDNNVGSNVDEQIAIMTDLDNKAERNPQGAIVIKGGVKNPAECVEAVAAYNLAAAVKDGAVIEKFTLSNPSDDKLRPAFCAALANFGKPEMIETGEFVSLGAEVWLVPAKYAVVTSEYTTDLPANSEDALLVNNKKTRPGNEHKTALMRLQMKMDRGIITRFVPVAELQQQGSNSMISREPLVSVFSRKSA